MQSTIAQPTASRRPEVARRGSVAGTPPGSLTPAARRPWPCRVGDADLWFAERPEQLEQAKQLCAACPVRAACLSGALSRAEPWGVWGGEIFDQGRVIARKRPRGRPRKSTAA